MKSFLALCRRTAGKDGTMEIKRNGTNGRRALSVAYGDLLYTSAQTQDVLKQLDDILCRGGTERSRVISATITLADMADYGAFNAVWDQWVADGFEPVRSVTEGHLAVPEYKVKISLIAALR